MQVCEPEKTGLEARTGDELGVNTARPPEPLQLLWSPKASQLATSFCVRLSSLPSKAS